MTDPVRPDYELADTLDLTTAAQHRAVGNLVRAQILSLLRERATTISQLAAALGVLKGSVSYHVRVLEQAGLIRVVRTRKVRGVVERYYGRAARRFELQASGETPDGGPLLLRTVAAELDRRPAPTAADPDLVTVVRSRLRADRAADFARRLRGLVEEFAAEHAPEQPMYGLAVAFYRTPIRPDAAAPPASQVPEAPEAPPAPPVPEAPQAPQARARSGRGAAAGRRGSA